MKPVPSWLWSGRYWSGLGSLLKTCWPKELVKYLMEAALPSLRILTLLRLFDALRELMTPPEPAKRPIGFVTHEDKKDLPGKPAGKRASTQAKAAGKKA